MRKAKKFGIGIIIVIVGFFSLAAIAGLTTTDEDRSRWEAERIAEEKDKERQKIQQNTQPDKKIPTGTKDKPKIVEQPKIVELPEVTKDVTPVIQSKSILNRVGDVVEIGGIAFNVTAAPSTSKGDFWDKPDGIFYRIPFSMENLGKEPNEVYRRDFTLIDGKDRKFEPPYVVFSKALSISENLQPGLQIERRIYFDIPYDETLQYNLEIEIGFESKIICVQNC